MMMKRFPTKWHRGAPLLLAVLTAMLTACASPSWQAPPLDVPAAWQATAPSAAVPAQSDQAYWQGFGDSQLLGLQTIAQTRNADLAVAAIRLRQAGFAVEKTGFNLRPNLNASLNKGASWTLNPTDYRGESTGANIGLSWEIDLWGKLADQQQAARWRATATAAELTALQHSVLASVANSYWSIARDQDALQLAQADLARAQATQAMIERRYQAGVVSGLELTQARSSTLQQENNLSQAQLNLAKSQWQLSILLDQPPELAPALVATLPHTFPEVAAGVPAEVLNRRPDLAAATARLQASFADQQAQQKSWYPTLALTGGVGTSSQQLANFLLNPVASLGAGLTLPFVQFNEMQLAKQISVAEYEAAVIEYRQKLYLALQEVETTLAALAHLRSELPRMQALAEQAQTAEKQTQLRYEAGALALDAVLTARTRRQAAEHALLLHRFQLAQANVALYKALGGAPQPAVSP